MLDGRAQPVEIAGDCDVKAGDLTPLGVEEIDAGLSDGSADDIGAARGADHRVGDLRIRDQHILDIARQIDDHRFAHTERHELR